MMDLLGKMKELAKSKPVTIIVCEGWDERCLRATETVLKEGYCNVQLLGDPAKIDAAIKEYGVDVSQAEIVDHTDQALRTELAPILQEARKHKGMDLETAEKLLDDVSYFGCTWALAGKCDGVAGSAICSTAELMRPVLQILRKRGRTVSEIFVIRDPDGRVFFMADGSMNIDPTSEQLVHIGANCVTAAKMFGIEPRVAFLSFSTKGSGGDGPQIQVVREAARLFKEEYPDIVSDGEFQFDAAVSPDAASRKCPNSPLQGDASILIMPNLTAGNILAHSILQYSKLSFDFSVIEGMQKPVTIIGRSVPTAKVVNAIISTAMQANS